ncbi:MAG: class I SAM-dependent methyltransferase [Lapillicoccus sp.]
MSDQPRTPDFDALYRRNEDPWAVRTSWYERRKLAVVVASLQRERYTSAWDPACGTGDLALALRGRCDRVAASDVSARAVAMTRELTRDAPGVQTFRHALPAPPEPLNGPVELVVLGEFLYYLPPADRTATYRLVDRVAAPTAEVLSVHWRHHPHDAWLSGEQVTAELDGCLRATGWSAAVRHTDLGFVLASWVRGDPPPETP